MGPRKGNSSKEPVPRLGYLEGFDDTYAFVKELGKGGNGVVRLAIHRQSGREFAVKSMPKVLRDPAASERKKASQIAYLKREVEVLLALRGTLNVANLEEVYEDSSHVHLVLELCRGGELVACTKGRHYSERTVASFMRAVLRTVAQCHAKNIVHRDIKPENFLLLTTEDTAPVKAIDFGLATFFDPPHLPVTNLTVEGTPWYLAPEACRAKWYPASDVWSCGVMAAYLLTGHYPFVDKISPAMPDLARTLRHICFDPLDLSGKQWTGLSEQALDFISSLLRPSAQQALAHPWLAGGTRQERAAGTPLDKSVVQRLQRFGRSGLFKRTVLQHIAQDLVSMHFSVEPSTHGGGVFRERSFRGGQLYRELSGHGGSLYREGSRRGGQLLREMSLRGGSAFLEGRAVGDSAHEGIRSLSLAAGDSLDGKPQPPVSQDGQQAGGKRQQQEQQQQQQQQECGEEQPPNRATSSAVERSVRSGSAFLEKSLRGGKAFLQRTFSTGSALSRAGSTMDASIYLPVATPYSRRLAELWDQMGLKSGDKVDRMELTKALKGIGYRITEEEGTELFNVLDTDNQGKLGRAEFSAGLMDWKAFQDTYKDRWLESVRRVFAEIDTDGSGTITADEIASSIGTHLSPYEVDAAVHLALLEAAGGAQQGEGAPHIDFDRFLELLRGGDESLDYFDDRLSNHTSRRNTRDLSDAAAAALGRRETSRKQPQRSNNGGCSCCVQ
ncbi:hypothetical protein N2152v2_011056 [Parachlorella kessleri]